MQNSDVALIFLKGGFETVVLINTSNNSYAIAMRILHARGFNAIAYNPLLAHATAHSSPVFLHFQRSTRQSHRTVRSKCFRAAAEPGGAVS